MRASASFLNRSPTSGAGRPCRYSAALPGHCARNFSRSGAMPYLCWLRRPAETAKAARPPARAPAPTRRGSSSCPSARARSAARRTPPARRRRGCPRRECRDRPRCAERLRRRRRRRRHVAVHRDDARLARQAQQHRAFAADGVHLRVDQALDQRRRHRGVDRVAARLEHVDAGVGRQVGVRRPPRRGGRSGGDRRSSRRSARRGRRAGSPG